MAGDTASKPGPDVGASLAYEGWQRELADLALLALEDGEVGALVENAVEVIASALDVEFVCLLEARDDRAEFLLRAGRGWGEDQVGVRTVSAGIDSCVEGVTMPAYAMMSGDPVRVEDLTADPRFNACPLLRDHGVVSGVMVKVYAGERLYGVLGAHAAHARAFTEHEGSWLADVARVIGGVVTRDRAGAVPTGDADASWQERFDALQDTMEVIASSSGGRGALVAAAQVAVRELADWCFVDLVEESGGAAGFARGGVVRRIIVGADIAGEEERRTAEELSYPLDPGAPHGTPKVVRSGEAQLVPKVSDRFLRQAANDASHLGSLRRLNPKSYMVVPLRMRGAVAGTLVMVSTDAARTFGEDELRRAKDLARCASLVLAGRDRVGAERGSGHDDAGVGPTDLVNVPAGRPPAELPPGLQPKQLDVLRLLSRGMSNTEAASALYLSESTVRSHLKKAYRALGVKNIQGALARARELGLLDD